MKPLRRPNGVRIFAKLCNYDFLRCGNGSRIITVGFWFSQGAAASGSRISMFNQEIEMFGKPTTVILASVFVCALISSTPASAAQKKPQFSRIPASARIVEEGKFVKVCTGSGDSEVCKPAYTRAKNRTAGPRFSKIKSGKSSLKVNNRYWTTCDVYGLCTTIYAGDGG
jgi:hypothetical protein